MRGSFEKAVTIEDLQKLAIRRLPDFVSDYLEQGAGDGGGVRRNVEAFRCYQLKPRILVDVSPVETGAELFGRRYAYPFGISAVGTGGIYRRGADEMLAQAARDANIPFILSGSASASIETISRIAPDHVWFQLYGSSNAEITADQLRRAKDAGVDVLVYTVDYPIPQRSQIVERTGISLGTGPTMRTLPKLMLDALRHPAWTLDYLAHRGIPKLESWAPYAPAGSNAQQIGKFYYDNWLKNNTWHDFEKVRGMWKGKLVVKGVVHPADVLHAAELGADAVTVSNHGGNKLDCMQGALESLKEVCETIDGKIPIFFDGGIRRGTDIAIALALGANHCFTGRATLYGVTAGGRPGAEKAIGILKTDLEYTLAMIGCKNSRDLSVDVLA